MARPILYSFVRCPYAMRARMAIAKSGVSCEMREVDLKDKPQAMMDVSPKGTVPMVLLSDGTVLDQSLDIMKWALGKKDPEGWLNHPEDEMSKLIEINDGEFVAALNQYKYPERYEGCSKEKARDTGFEFLKNLEMRIAAKGFVIGNTASLADIAIFPLVRQFALVDWMWFEDCNLMRLKIWLNYFMDSELFEVVMEKYSPWQPGDPVDVFPIFNSAKTANARA
jgi:glutathione S-transferase